MTNLWAVVPVKSLARAKRRLGPALSPPERARLVQEMLAGVLRALAQAQSVGRWLVISRDPQALALASQYGGVGLRERGRGLNRALRQAAQFAAAGGAEALLVLPADLPLIAAEDIDALAARAGEKPCAVIAPAQDGGTNALLLRPPGALEFQFGPHSFQAHTRQAQERGLPLDVFASPGTALDIDTPQDLRRWARLRADRKEPEAASPVQALGGAARSEVSREAS